MGRKQTDITGQRFGKLIALSVSGQSVGGTTMWLCVCDCGKNTIVMVSNLNNGSTQSCGCLKQEKLLKKNKKYNIYDFSQEYGVGYTTSGACFYFDVEDYDKIKDLCWSKDSKGYIRSSIQKKRISMARLLTNCPTDQVVDHINGIIYDNRKSNLRICTQANNTWNTKKITSNTGHTGVYIDKRSGRYYARITCHGIIHYLGSSRLFSEAVQMRIDGEKKYFAEFRRNE
jgi:hypothetical protein